VSKEAATKSASPSLDGANAVPVWGYILRQRGLSAILETSREKNINRTESIDKSLFRLGLDQICFEASP